MGLVAERAAREPAGEEESDGEASSHERIGEVALRPRPRPHGLDGPRWPRGESADAFSDHEGIAAEDYGNVMMPARERADLEVIDPELTFKVLVQAFGSPALLERASDLLFAHPPRQRSESKLLGFFSPLGNSATAKVVPDRRAPCRRE